jgi:hypothetical protein
VKERLARTAIQPVSSEKNFLLKFARDRRSYSRWVFEEKTLQPTPARMQKYGCRIWVSVSDDMKEGPTLSSMGEIETIYEGG